jgi:hypothetical protein
MFHQDIDNLVVQFDLQGMLYNYHFKVGNHNINGYILDKYEKILRIHKQFNSPISK